MTDVDIDAKIECYQCYKVCEEIYQIKVIDEVGKMTFEKVCTEKCASEVKHEIYHLHKRRAEEVRDCSIQKLK